MRPPRLSILNFSSSPAVIVHLGELCDSIPCFHRFWIGEHHTASQVPDALGLSMLVAGMTERIRVGTGAVGLGLRNPYLIAESATLAETFYPGRIDLGVTRGGAGAEAALSQLLDGADASARHADYPRRLELLAKLLSREVALDEGSLQLPVGPPIFVMGTTVGRAQHAGALGLGLVASFHHGGTEDGIRAMLKAYRDSFRPSRLFEAPETIAVVSGFVSSDAGRVTETMERIRAWPTESLAVSSLPSVSVFGGPIAAALELRRLAAAVEADEMMFLAFDAIPDSTYSELAEGWMSTGD